MRVVLVLVVVLLSACGPEPGGGVSALPDAGIRDAGAPPVMPKRAKAPKRMRSTWVLARESVAQRYPAYGVTLYHLSHVYEAPDKASRAIGYMRRGARFRASEEVSRTGCPRGWFEVPHEGFVCNGDGFIIDSEPPPYDSAPVAAALWDALPYSYAKVLGANVPQYMRIPLPDEEQTVLTWLAGVGASTTNPSAPPPQPIVPEELSGLLRSAMQPGFYVSVDRIESTAGGAFARTVRGGFVRKEQLVDATLPAGLGVALGRRYTLPLAFVYRGGAPVLRLDPVTGEAVKTGGNLPLHSPHALTGESILRSGRRYFVTREGLLLRDTSVRVVDRVARPKTVPARERWIRVDLDRQTLTAYDGEVPVFATLVSSGLPDHATPSGIFRLHAKHVTATMADDMASDGPYSIEDVPWTMYFSGSYALHAAFWHERFGHPRSHGCINLAPRDARWLFFWTAPELPSAWHGVLAGVGEGTTVVLDTGVPYAIEQS